MTAVIKSRDATASASVRPLMATGGSSRTVKFREPPVDANLLALRRDLSALQQQLEDQDAAIGKHPSDLDRAFQDGKAEGRVEGRKEADDQRAALASKLDKGVEQAVQLFAREMSSLERLAGLLACEGLEKILGVSDDQAGLLRRVIRVQLDGLDAQAVVRIEVSSQDFPSPPEIAELTSAVGRPGLDIQATDQLQSGDCRIKLRLGELEVGVNQQWGRLRATLEAMAEPGPQ